MNMFSLNNDKQRMKKHESKLGKAYRKLYNGLCGAHPYLSPWHFQYLNTFYLYRDLKKFLPSLRGDVVLDVGCGNAPYKTWFGREIKYIGIDTQPGEGVQHLIDGESEWPIADESVDIVLCTQVFEHANNFQQLLSEINRTLRGEGRLVATFPFIYNEHGAPNDYRRISAHGAEIIFPGWRVVLVKRQGGIGSTLALLWLNWRDLAMNRNFALRLMKATLLPIWIFESMIINVLGLLLDKIDRTDSFYSNVMVVLEKPEG